MYNYYGFTIEYTAKGYHIVDPSGWFTNQVKDLYFEWWIDAEEYIDNNILS